MPVQHLPTGIDMYYETYGQGEPVVLIQGTGFSADVWLPYQAEALAKSVQVIVFDQRGCGRTTHYKGGYTIEQMACDVVALLDHLRIPAAHVVGHSMGGRIGIALALTYPDRVKSQVLAAAGSGVGAYPGAAAVPGIPHALAMQLLEMGLKEFVRWSIFDTSTYFTAKFRQQRPEVVRHFYETVWPRNAELHEYIQLVIARHTWEATHRLGDVTAPTLVVVGDEDLGVRSHVPQSDILAQRIPGAQLKLLKGLSHMFFWEVPAESNALVLDWVLAHAG